MVLNWIGQIEKKVKTIHITQPLLRNDLTHVGDFRSARGRGEGGSNSSTRELIAFNQTKFSGNSHFYFRQLVEDM